MNIGRCCECECETVADLEECRQNTAAMSAEAIFGSHRGWFSDGSEEEHQARLASRHAATSRAEGNPTERQNGGPDA